ncbi:MULTISPECIES: HNH endonuclease [Burkholderia cepacia complex]|uniref:HNH endonuclease n=1 Tax=Burkholderia cepacia complex TaxID=87882 RepID=UPI000503EEBB|nr:MULTISPECIES: HNH endonuclease [Burkholderia cepacia complex]KFL49448.1 hypothetical protein JM78_34470 [Burkholderia pyrrocinia]UJH77462.1 HNH endonuclease [Burkholderia cenocepacia]
MSTRYTLHEAIIEVLTNAGRPLSARAIADEVNALDRYTRGDGVSVQPEQIRARVRLNAYSHLFVIEDGLIALAPRSNTPHTRAKLVDRDYRALGRYFRTLKCNEVTMRFADIEAILGGQLPPVARRSKTAWQNSDPFLPKPDGHKWAHEWVKAGWWKTAVDIPQETVVFERDKGRPPISALEDLRPIRQDSIYDILKRVPISVEAWHTTQSGHLVKNFKANPHFCYDWSFGSSDEGYAVCFWHENLRESSSDAVYSDTNYRAGAQDRRRRAETQGVSDQERARLIAQAKRGEAMDRAIRETFHLRKPLHVMICSRGKSSGGEASAGISSVKGRELDAVTWTVHAYDDETGACRVVRGSVRALGDETVVRSAESDEWIARYTERLIRPEQAAFRRAVSAAYDNRCAISGCDIPEVLEAAHVRGRDWRAGHNEAADGILLRRDLHALYDRGLLAVVEGVARFSSGVLHHYAHLDGQPVAECRDTGRDGEE